LTGRGQLLARRALVLSAALVFACDREPQGSTAGAKVALHGAGASFPYPLYSKWVAEYHRLYPNIRINYQSIGSGGGIRQVVAETVDFGATDAPMLDEETRGAPGKLLHVPTAVGSVVVSYNLGGVNRTLKFTPGLLASIFLGEINRWNAPDLAAINPGVSLPDAPIAVIFRTDGSGTTATFSEALASASPSFKHRVGSGKNVSFPIGLGAKGNEGVTGQLKNTPGSIGYIELAYATQSGLPRAEIQNRAGKFVGPAPRSATSPAEEIGAAGAPFRPQPRLRPNDRERAVPMGWCGSGQDLPCRHLF
jgi:phosphate transport system substrate-binding protein